MVAQGRSILAMSLALGAALAMATPAMAQAKKDTEAVKTKSQVPPAAKKADPAMDRLLAEWEKKSAQIKSLSAKLTRTDVSKVFNRTTNYIGQAQLQSPNLAYLDFYLVDANADPKAKPTFDERIVCNGKNVYQFKGPTRQVAIFPLAKDERQKALEEGPLPFLFNMSAKKAKERYEMSLMTENDTYYFINIIPLLAIDREEYLLAQVQLDKKQFLPRAIKLTLPNGKDTKLFQFEPKDLVANKVIADSMFDGNEMIYGANGVAKGAKPWTVLKNPPAGSAPQGPVDQVGSKPIAKPADRRK